MTTIHDRLTRMMQFEGLKRDPALAALLRDHGYAVAEAKETLDEFSEHAWAHGAAGHAVEYREAVEALDRALDEIDSVIRTLEDDEA